MLTSIIDPMEKSIRNTYIGLAFLGFVGWLFGGIVSSMSENPSLMWASLIFPICGVISWLIQIMGARKYFAPSLINLALSFTLATFLIPLFALAALYLVLDLAWWLFIVFCSIFMHSIVWYYNQVDSTRCQRAMLKRYRKGTLSLDTIDYSLYLLHEAPEWLKKLFILLIVIIIVMLAGHYFSNKLFNHSHEVLIYSTASGLIGFSLMMTMMSARLFSLIRPTIALAKAVAKEKQAEEGGQ